MRGTLSREEFLRQLPALAKNYQPADGVKDSIKDVSLLIIIGPSGVGKTAIIDRLGMPYVLVHTTRMPRPGERDGKDFRFLSDYAGVVIQIKNGEFVQMVVGVSGDLYATKPSSYPKSGVAAMPVLADAVPFFRKLGFKDTISAFITPPSFEEWQRRLKSHLLTKVQKTRRLAEAKRSLRFALKDEQMHFILNDELDEAVAQTKDLISGKVNKEREEMARQTAAELLKGIH